MLEPSLLPTASCHDGIDLIDARRPRQAAPDQRQFWSDAIFIAALILVCGLSVFIGMPAPLHSYAHDTFFLLDNAYRVIQGQVPHRDFSSAWGPVIYLIDAGGLVLSGMRPTGLGYANALFGSLIAIWAFLIVRTRWSSASACAVGIYTILLITAPFPIGSDLRDFSFAMIYNRYGYALLGIIVIECAANVLTESVDAPARFWMRQSTDRAISTGFALGLLAFLKISYAIVAVPFVALSIISCDTGRRRQLLGLCCGFVILAVPVLWYLRFDLSDMLQDLATAAAGRGQSLQPLHSISMVDLMQSFILLIFAGLRDSVKTGVTDNLIVRLRGTLFALITVAANYLLLISNQQIDTFPLNGYAAVALAADNWRLTTGDPLKWRGFAAGFLRALLLAVCLLPFSLQNGLSLAVAARERQWPNTPNVVSLASTERGAYLLFRPATGMSEITGAQYVEAVNDGLELIRRHSGARDGVMTFDEFNPFNYLLDRPSPRGGIAAAAYNYIFSDAAHPTAERFLGDAPYVMVRKYRSDGSDVTENDNVVALMRIYGPALQAQFSVVEETEHWVLWRRKKP